MNKKLLCTAVGGALALAAAGAHAHVGSPYGTALIPYVVKDVNRTTVVTVVINNNSVPSSASNLMHLQYWTKSTTDANTAACKPSSVTVPVTANDIVTFDTGGILGYPLFGDSTNPSPLGMSISYAGPQHGYLVIQSPFAYSEDQALYLQGTYWLELDLANGGAHGDFANHDYQTGGNFATLLPFSVLVPDDAANVLSAAAVNFWPSSVASTAFTVTPLGSAMVTRENNAVVMQVFNHSGPPVQGAYDRNENGVDGTVPVTVRCVGRLTPAQLMPGVVANASWAVQGGWGFLANLGNGNNTAIAPAPLRAIVYQVDTSLAGGKFVDNATRIVTDSANGS